jgi:hypothetical protein
MYQINIQKTFGEVLFPTSLVVELGNLLLSTMCETIAFSARGMWSALRVLIYKFIFSFPKYPNSNTLAKVLFREVVLKLGKG